MLNRIDVLAVAKIESIFETAKLFAEKLFKEGENHHSLVFRKECHTHQEF